MNFESYNNNMQAYTASFAKGMLTEEEYLQYTHIVLTEARAQVDELLHSIDDPIGKWTRASRKLTEKHSEILDAAFCLRVALDIK